MSDWILVTYPCYKYLFIALWCYPSYGISNILFSARPNERAQPVQGSVNFMDILDYKLTISHPTPFPTYDDFIFHTQILNLSIAPIALMAVCDEAESPGQLPFEPTMKDTLGTLFNHYISVQNLMLSQRMLLCLRSEDRRFQTLNDHSKSKWYPSTVNTKLKVWSASHGAKDHWEVRTTIPQSPKIKAPQSIKAVVQGAETKVIAGPSSAPEAPVEIIAISNSVNDLPHEPIPTGDVPTHKQATLHQSPPLVIAGESKGIENTDEQPSQKGSLKSRVWFYLVFHRL